MPSTAVKLGVAQSHTRPSTYETLAQVERLAIHAASESVHLLLFPEAYLGGYPRSCSFGSTVGARTDEGREQFLQHVNAAIDLGDTPTGSGSEWVERRLEIKKGEEYRGDGTREKLEAIAANTGLFLVLGVIEKAGGSLYCSVVYVCPRLGCIGKRRKVMPTGTERAIWTQGSTSTLRAVTTTLNGVKVTLAAAVCWENFMPLLRFSLYSQNVNIYLAPTADSRATWLPLLRTIASEGRCFVLSSNQCVERRNLPSWISGSSPEQYEDDGPQIIGPKLRRTSVVTKTEDNHEITWPAPLNEDRQALQASSSVNEASLSPLRLSSIPSDDEAVEDEPEKLQTQALNGHVHSLPSKTPGNAAVDGKESRTHEEAGPNFVCRGGSCIISPTGEVLAGPLWDVQDSFITATVDFDDCIRGKLDFDAAGSYSRMDSFELKVKDLDLNPPP